MNLKPHINYDKFNNLTKLLFMFNMYSMYYCYFLTSPLEKQIPFKNTHYAFGRGASKSTTQGGIFDLNMYITFDCAEIAAF